MKRAANEVMTLAAKAARGAGARPGQAIEFGRAALCHLIAGRNAQALTSALDALPDGPVMTLPVAIARLLETAQGNTAEGELPASDLTRSYLEAQPFSTTYAAEGDTLNITFDLNTPNQIRPTARVNLPQKLHDLMQDLAAKTLVPESAASRLSGAGAGLTDND